MIVPMKKVTIATTRKRVRMTLEQLRRAGVVHVDVAERPSNELEISRSRLAELERAGFLLPTGKKKIKQGPNLSMERALKVAQDINASADAARQKREELEKVQREWERQQVWGDFEPAIVRELAKSGIIVRLYELTKDQLGKLPPNLVRQKVWEQRGRMGYVLLARSEADFPQGVEETPMPSRSLHEVEADVGALKSAVDANLEHIRALGFHHDAILAAAEECRSIVEFESVRASMDEDSGIALVSGFVPAPAAQALTTLAIKEGWAILIRDPEADEQVPTLVKTPGWVGIIKPVFDLLGTVPGYRERDISMFFLVFFAFFFAVIIGDAGYGLVFLSLSVLMGSKEAKSQGKLSQGTVLLLILAVSTISWGAVTGTWFGSQSLAELPFLRWMIIPELYAFNDESAELVKLITFLVGFVHLSIAHVWNFFLEIRQKPRIRAFAQFGWLALLVGCLALVLNLVLDSKKYPLPDITWPLILGGVGFIFVFGQQEGNFIKGVIKAMAGTINTILSCIGVFADIISYIRLFAVGLAGIEIAKSFNGMAAGINDGSVFGLVFAAMVLVLGHGLNLAMGALSIVVHGVRLNMLEFSNHLGMEWSGTSYQPFALRKQEESQAT